MKKPEVHILVCASFRGTEAKGKCIKKGSLSLIQYLEEECADRSIDAVISSTGCLNLCDRGPILVVYPMGHWYGGIEGEDAIDEILDAIEEGKPAEHLLLA